MNTNSKLSRAIKNAVHYSWKDLNIKTIKISPSFYYSSEKIIGGGNMDNIFAVRYFSIRQNFYLVCFDSESMRCHRNESDSEPTCLEFIRMIKIWTDPIQIDQERQ